MNMTPSEQPSALAPNSGRAEAFCPRQKGASTHEGLTPAQRVTERPALEEPLPKADPKIVDLRVNIDLIIVRFYVVLFVGKDRRKSSRPATGIGGSAFANRLAAIVLLVGLNIAVSIFIFLSAYLIKSSLGINLFARHLGDYLK